jgi:conjugal transfer pilus assembly protein TraK
MNANHIFRAAARAVVAIFLVACGGTALALQTLEVRDGDTTIVRVSLRDPTRIRVIDGRVTDVYGAIFDAKDNPAGRISVIKDEATGEIYVQPVLSTAPTPGANAPATAPSTIEVRTDRGTVGLALSPADVIGETVQLHIVGGAPKVSDEGAAIFANKATSHDRAIKALTLAMANPQLSEAAPGRDLPSGPREVSLWKEARFVLKRTHEVPGLVGEVYDLTNVSAQRMVIDEREFYRPGVLSVAVRQLVLEPGEATPVWIVRKNTN